MKEDETVNSKYAEVFRKVTKSFQILLVTNKVGKGENSATSVVQNLIPGLRFYSRKIKARET